jgi:hypothetical protein
MADRGKIIEVELSKPILFNEEIFTKARIEIEHVNFGLDPKTKKLNTIKRSNFSSSDICQFLFELDGMELVPGKVDEDFKYFALEVLNPLKGTGLGKKYRLIFTISLNEVGILGTITLYRIR